MTAPQASLLCALLLVGCAARGPAPKHPQDEGPTAEQLYAGGLALGDAGDYVRAEQYIEAAIERGYPMDQATPDLVRVCVAASQLRAALRYAEPHLLRHPNDSVMRYLVASIHFGLDQPVRARDELVVLNQRDPKHAEAQYLLGVLQRDAFANPGEARRYFRKYLELEPHGTHASEAVAWLVETPVEAANEAGEAPEEAVP